MPNRKTPIVSLLLIIVVLNSSLAFAQRRPASEPGQRAKRPKLVLLIVIDQFRYDYLERFSDLFVANGLKRLMREGASWTQSNYDHVPTYTAPGHATMMTGAYPAETGIVGNEWPDRKTGKNVTSVSDSTVTLLGGSANEGASSPRRLMSSTVGDELRIATNDRSKVIGISVKDRSAILPAGRHANAAYWLSNIAGNMVSSTYYFPELPNWVTAFNNTRPADKFFKAKWERLLPESEYLKRAGADSPPWENIGTVAGETNAFPHTITGGAQAAGREFYSALDSTPFTNDILLSFAQQAIENEQLGQDDDTDVLSVSFSANDYVGHRYGPYSQEAMDITLRV
ncbi:MAG: alkaline phosphatase family protein, partial [Acidobacteria bacterium]